MSRPELITPIPLPATIGGRVSRPELLEILRGLMGSEHMGDVAGEIKKLHDVLGLPRPQGDPCDGYTDEDWDIVEL